MGPSCRANGSPWHGSSVCWHVWRKAGHARYGSGVRSRAQHGRPWVGEGAEPRRAGTSVLRWAVHVRPRPLAELSAVRRGVQARALRTEEASKRLERSRPWGDGPRARASVARGDDPGSHTLALAPRVVHPVAQVWAPDCGPRLLTEGCKTEMTGVADPRGPAGPAGPSPSPGAYAPAPWAAVATVALGASGQDGAAPASG